MPKVKSKTSKFHQKAELVYKFGRQAAQDKILFLSTQDESFNGREITINNQKFINYGSCSYLGLETHEKLKKGSIDAIKKYGTQFSSSRSFVSSGLYSEAEDLLSIIFNNKPVVVTTSTSMGHLTALPVIVGPNDLVLCDQQAHFSMQYTFSHLAANGADIFICKHNDIDQLENQIKDNYLKYDKIWYLIDGVYSMYGDFAPFDKIEALLNKYEKLHLYVDDAHGFSWTGKNGSGYCLSKMQHHDRMVLLVSLSKSFACGGGAIIFPNQDMFERVRYYGGHLSFSGPLQPSVIASCIESAKLHLSNEIYTLQSDFEEKRKYCNQLAHEYNVPIVSNQYGPIFFVGLSINSVGLNMVNRLFNDGCYVNIGTFPAVPQMRTGIRFTVTNNHTFDDIENLIKSIAKNLPIALREEDRTMKDIERAFRRVPSFKMPKRGKIINLRSQELTFRRYNTIVDINQHEWDNKHKNNNGLSYNILRLLEKSFYQNNKKEHNWDFFYYEIKDKKDELILSACFCVCLIKDDMLMSNSISNLVENERNERNDPYYLTSEALILGTPFTEQNHLYLNKNHKLWEKAISIMLDELWKEQDKRGINTIMLKNFSQDKEIFKKLYDFGFVQFENATALGEKNNNQSSLNYKNDPSQLQYKFGSKETEIDQIQNLFELEAVNNLEANRFSLPAKLFKNIHNCDDLETVRFYNENNLEVICFSVVDENNCAPLFIGSANGNVGERSLAIDRANKKLRATINQPEHITINEDEKILSLNNLNRISFIQQRDNYNQKMIDNVCLKWSKLG